LALVFSRYSRSSRLEQSASRHYVGTVAADLPPKTENLFFSTIISTSSILIYLFSLVYLAVTFYLGHSRNILNNLLIKDTKRRAVIIFFIIFYYLRWKQQQHIQYHWPITLQLRILRLPPISTCPRGHTYSRIFRQYYMKYPRRRP